MKTIQRHLQFTKLFANNVRSFCSRPLRLRESFERLEIHPLSNNSSPAARKKNLPFGANVKLSSLFLLSELVGETTQGIFLFQRFFGHNLVSTRKFSEQKTLMISYNATARGKNALLLIDRDCVRHRMIVTPRKVQTRHHVVKFDLESVHTQHMRQLYLV